MYIVIVVVVAFITSVSFPLFDNVMVFFCSKTSLRVTIESQLNSGNVNTFEV